MRIINNRILLSAMLLLPLAGGCGSRFAGEWVQDAAKLDDGSFSPMKGERSLALQFLPPSTVRVGMYSNASGVVDDDTVSIMDYQTIQNRSVAEFGAYTARVEDGQLIAFIGGVEKGRFRKLSGQSVFPPMVKLPQIVRATPPMQLERMPSILPPALTAGTVATAPRPAEPAVLAADVAK